MATWKERIDGVAGVLSIGATIIALVSGLISLCAYLRTGALERHIAAIKPLEMHITVSEPASGASVSGFLAELKGKVEIRHMSTAQRGPDVIVDLAEKGIEIVPFVRPLSSHNLWHAQTKASLTPDGKMAGSLNFGDRDGPGIGLAYHVVVLAVPAGTVRQGARFADLPTHGNASETVTVKRVQ